MWKAKREFIEKHGLVIWRLHDHWHARKPDGIQMGMTEALAWGKYQDPENEHLYTLPETTLRQLADEVATEVGFARRAGGGRSRDAREEHRASAGLPGLSVRNSCAGNE